MEYNLQYNSIVRDLADKFEISFLLIKIRSLVVSLSILMSGKHTNKTKPFCGTAVNTKIERLG